MTVTKCQYRTVQCSGSFRPRTLSTYKKSSIRLARWSMGCKVTPNAIRNKAEFDRRKLSRRTKLTNISQQWSINILKPLIFVCQKGSLCCALIGQNLISVICHVLVKLPKTVFTFCHSVTSAHFGR